MPAMRTHPLQHTIPPSSFRAGVVILSLVTSLACGGSKPTSEEPVAEGTDLSAHLAGSWRAVLQSPGGALPFGLEVVEDTATGELKAFAINGEERAPFSGVSIDGDTVEFSLDFYDARIRATYDAGAGALAGEWSKTIPGGESRLPFSAGRGSESRFEPVAANRAGSDSVPDISGVWSVEFTDDDGSEPARGEFSQSGNRVVGTFLTPTGDYRYLEGTYESGFLRLSTFDGAHAFLFSASAQPDGSLSGDFWSRDVYHATWTATRGNDGDEEVLEWASLGLANDDGRFRFDFPDLDGQQITLDDKRFDDQVVIVNIFGSWCPNCNDEAPLLAAWDRQWRSEGLSIVGLAYEFSGDPERDASVVRRYAERHGIEFPLLLAGTSDKGDAAATLPDLTEVIAYPTTVFIGRDGKVRRIHSGFSGPGTGIHYERLVESLETTITELLAEKPA